MTIIRFPLMACLLICSTASVLGQEVPKKVVLKKDFEIQKHTVMALFEEEYTLSAQERAELKNKRIAAAEFTLGVLDTLEISDRKRRLLIHDLKYNPLSDRLTQFIAETKIEDEEAPIGQPQ